MGVYRDPTSKLYEFTEYHGQGGAIVKFDTNTRFLISEVGYGMPPVRYITVNEPLRHGAIYQDFRLEPRVIQIVFRENACNRDDYWLNRANLLNILRPNRHPQGYVFMTGTLKKMLSTGVWRNIDVTIEQGPEFKARELESWDEWSVYETLRFIAPDPTFYDPNLQSVTQLATATSSPILSTTINYPGTWHTYPTLKITGPVNSAILINSGSGETIRFTANIPGGTTITIDTNAKTVVDHMGTNWIGYVNPNSDLASFHMASEPEAASGNNTFTLNGSGATIGVTKLVIDYQIRYIGI